MEQTFVIVKPGAVQRGLIGKIISRFEMRGLKIVALKMIHITSELAEKHYAEHKGKPFFEDLVNFITSSPVVVMVLKGENAITVARTMMGATDPLDAAPGTIRGDFGLFTGKNIVHGSDSQASAEREIHLFFSDNEFVAYKKCDEEWLYE